MGRRQGILLFYMCIAIGALLLLAASLPRLAFQPGRSFALGASQPLTVGSNVVPPASLGDAGYWRVLFTVIFLGLSVTLALALIFSAKLRWEFFRRMISAIGAVLFFYLVVSFLRRMPPDTRVAPPARTMPIPPPPVTGERLPAFVAQPSQWLTTAISVCLAALLIAGIWFFWRRGQKVANPVVALAQEALASIQSGGDVHDTVLRCYLDMSRVLGEQRGIERQRAMTPREFEQHLAASGVRDQHIRQLTRLFERARYSSQRPSEQDERAAVDCLTAIVQTYGRST
jgi:hypothetical protein